MTEVEVLRSSLRSYQTAEHAALDSLQAENERLTKERDEARRGRDEAVLRWRAEVASLEARLNEGTEALELARDHVDGMGLAVINRALANGEK